MNPSRKALAYRPEIPELRDEFDNIISEMVPASNDVVTFLTWGITSITKQDSDSRQHWMQETVAICELEDGTVVHVFPEWLKFVKDLEQENPDTSAGVPYPIMKTNETIA